MKRTLSQAAIAALFLTTGMSVSGCVAAGVGGTTYAVKASQRGALEEDAKTGDPAAQYALGLSHCCMGPGFSTQTATEWLCLSAKQGHAPAQYELGRIYAGEISRTPTPGQKVLSAVTARSDPILSQAWFELAARQGHQKAIDRLKGTGVHLGAEELQKVGVLLSDPAHMPCEYEDVFGG